MTEEREVFGVLAVLHQPMGGKPLTVGEPGPALYGSLPLPMRLLEVAVGEVTDVWREGDQVHYSGVLSPGDVLADRLAGEIGAGKWVGLMVAEHGQMGMRSGGTLFTGWQVSAVSLVPARSRPWPEAHLSLVPELLRNG